MDLVELCHEINIIFGLFHASAGFVEQYGIISNSWYDIKIYGTHMSIQFLKYSI